MYCTNCGESILEHAEICPKCGVRPYRINNYCYNCGAELKEHQEMCVNCGVTFKKQTESGATKTLEPWVAALLSLVVVGLGQIVIGQVKKGLVVLIGSVFLVIITFGWSAFITWILAGVDAYAIAKKINQGKEVGEWEFF